MFSRRINVVADTNIFARESDNGGQFLVYSMKFQAGEDLAMILPLPTPKGSAEDAVTFINLEGYGRFFADMRLGFPEFLSRDAHSGMRAAPRTTLAVVEVGDFVASFVPTMKDFDRLDPQFRLPEGVWEKLPQYKTYGFAVFKLKKPEKGPSQVHPMAFEFPRADRKSLFFPTLHIHDGRVPSRADFDHSLFWQNPDETPARWERSREIARAFIQVEKTEGIVDGDAFVHRKVLKGNFVNDDIVVDC